MEKKWDMGDSSVDMKGKGLTRAEQRGRVSHVAGWNNRNSWVKEDCWLETALAIRPKQ